MSETSPPYEGQDDKARQTSVSLYERDLHDAERVRVHHKLDSFSQAVRRAIRDAAESVDAAESQDAKMVAA